MWHTIIPKGKEKGWGEGVCHRDNLGIGIGKREPWWWVMYSGERKGVVKLLNRNAIMNNFVTVYLTMIQFQKEE